MTDEPHVHDARCYDIALDEDGNAQHVPIACPYAEPKGSTKQLIARVEKYLTERARIGGLHQDSIHSLHDGAEREAHLTVADLRALIALARLTDNN